MTGVWPELLYKEGAMEKRERMKEREGRERACQLFTQAVERGIGGRGAKRLLLN